MKSARINFGIPDSEYIMEVDDFGAATSLVNQNTGTEYVGGGGGDFSTAEVTITNKTSDPVPQVDMAYLDSDNIYVYPQPLIPNIPAIFEAVLYKGSVEIAVMDYNFGDLSGNCEYGDNGLIITGDCSFSITE